jgi:hypothetical protein
MRIQLLVLGSTGVVVLAMAIFMATRKPFIALAPPPQTEQTAQTAEEEPSKAAPVPWGTRPTGPLDPDAASRANLRRLLSKLARSQVPARRQVVIEKVRERLEDFEPFLIEILSEEWDRSILQAIDLVGEFELDGAALDLRLLAYGSTIDQVKAAAIRTAESLRPWPTRQLRRWLDVGTAFPEPPLVLVAVLEVCSRRDDRPTDMIVPLVGHAENRVRVAAIDAIPMLASGKDLDALCSLAKSADGMGARAAAEALGRTAMPREAEECLHELLQSGNWMVVREALSSLSSKASALSNVEPLLAVLRDESKSIEERIYGFIAMENTGSVPADEVRELIPGLHPLLQLLAARCLLTAGDEAGIPVLIDLLETEESETVHIEERICVREGARSVLAEIAGEDLGPATGPWQRWHRDFGDMGPIDLRIPAPTFW